MLTASKPSAAASRSAASRMAAGESEPRGLRARGGPEPRGSRGRAGPEPLGFAPPFPATLDSAMRTPYTTVITYTVRNEEIDMPFARWLITFIGFPLGGWLSIETVGGVHDLASGAAAGAVAGVVIGLAQGAALRDRVSLPGWALHTTLGMSAGMAAAGAVTAGSASTGSLALTPLIAGATVGASQAPVLGVAREAAVAWVATVAGAWALGWVVTANVIVDAERGYTVFGASGALLAMLIPAPVRTRPALNPAVGAAS